MPQIKFTPLELRIMRALWDRGAVCIRDIQESFPKRGRPSYTTIQTTVYRLEGKGAIRRVRKIGNAHIFEAVVPRSVAQGRFIDSLLDLFGGGVQPVMAHLIKTGRLTMDDVKEARNALHAITGEEERP